jgi:hypothetical protein
MFLVGTNSYMFRRKHVAVFICKEYTLCLTDCKLVFCGFLCTRRRARFHARLLLIDLIVWTKFYRKSKSRSWSLCIFLQPHVTYFSLSSRCLFQHPFSTTFSPVCSINVADNVSPHKNYTSLQSNISLSWVACRKTDDSDVSSVKDSPNAIRFQLLYKCCYNI